MGVLAAGKSQHFLKLLWRNKLFIKIFHQSSKNPRATAKAIATFKETTNCKIPHTAGVIDDVHIMIMDPNAYSKIDYCYRK